MRLARQLPTSYVACVCNDEKKRPSQSLVRQSDHIARRACAVVG
jgi:hypothetical protein